MNFFVKNETDFVGDTELSYYKNDRMKMKKSN